MTEVHSNLLGEVVDVSEFEYRGGSGTYHRRARGQVRAVYHSGDNLYVLVENEESYENAGRLCMYSLSANSVLVVAQCPKCKAWGRKAWLDLATFGHFSANCTAAL